MLMPNQVMGGKDNSSDVIKRTINGIDNETHADNPADVLHYFEDITATNTSSYGYPNCYTVWNPDVF
jgi:hypothetical protein